MRYSRFNEASGMYDVFEDARPHALNADLPVPKLGALVNNIGVPARTAGRPLPSSAQFVGQSWEPMGIVVAGQGGELGAVDWRGLGPVAWIGGGAVLFGIVGALRGNLIGGAAAGALLGGVGHYVAKENQ